MGKGEHQIATMERAPMRLLVLLLVTVTSTTAAPLGKLESELHTTDLDADAVAADVRKMAAAAQAVADDIKSDSQGARYPVQSMLDKMEKGYKSVTTALDKEKKTLTEYQGKSPLGAAVKVMKKAEDRTEELMDQIDDQAEKVHNQMLAHRKAMMHLGDGSDP